MKENPLKDGGNKAEITRKLCGKFHFRIRKSSTKFHIKVRKPKSLFEKGLERYCKSKNVLEFDVEKIII